MSALAVGRGLSARPGSPGSCSRQQQQRIWSRARHSVLAGRTTSTTFRTRRKLAVKAVTRRRVCTCKSERDFLFSKLDEVEQTFKEMNERLADPEVVGNSTEFQKLAKSVSDIQPLVDARQEHRDLLNQVAEARGMMGWGGEGESERELMR